MLSPLGASGSTQSILCIIAAVTTHPLSRISGPCVLFAVACHTLPENQSYSIDTHVIKTHTSRQLAKENRRLGIYDERRSKAFV